MLSTNQIKAFTLLEIMVVIVIIGAIAGFAIPNYAKTIEKTYERDAITQLQTIHAANNLYRSRSGSYWPGDSMDHDLTDINTNLGISIIANGLIYSCNGDGTIYSCDAERDLDPPKNFVVTVDQSALDTNNPSCVGCP